MSKHSDIVLIYDSEVYKWAQEEVTQKQRTAVYKQSYNFVDIPT